MLEARRRAALERRAQQAAALEAAKARRRRRVRIEIALFVLSAIAVAGILYYDTTRVADGYYALHFRGGRIVDVKQAGHVYRIPILDHVVQIDKGVRPLPALRRTAKSAQGSTVQYEALLTFRVIDAGKFWIRFAGADDDAARLASRTAEQAIADAIAARSDGQLGAPDAAAALGPPVAAAIDQILASSGLKVDQLRFVGLRVAQ